jgi:hypothetical protein
MSEYTSGFLSGVITCTIVVMAITFLTGCTTINCRPMSERGSAMVGPAAGAQ